LVAKLYKGGGESGANSTKQAARDRAGWRSLTNRCAAEREF
jgi:hypothetical protein